MEPRRSRDGARETRETLRRGRAVAREVLARPLPWSEEGALQGPRVYTDGEAAIALDARFPPLFITTWFGAPTTSLVDAYFERSDVLFDGAVTELRKLVLITDLGDADYADATVRRRLAEATEARQDRGHSTCILGNFVVVRSAAVRGALTAIGWLSETTRSLTLIKDMETALSRAAAILERHGLAFDPRAMAGVYTRPGRPRAE